ncbi:hypothetical protein CHARACLAT_016640 [Characodon lateralis]|uniref:Uncharacterized protein n=1 Tax=Characodon lateralis TaxID=208331 RepID=A0ABU7EJP0_9TELE|nr:hypothetical protein [Characodon lateralis]
MHTKQKTHGHTITASMVEVMGPDGPHLVFRSCTSQDIDEFAKLLPDIAQSGEAFSTEFTAFCRENCPTGAEIRRILARKMAASDIAKIHDKLPDVNVRLRHEAWDNIANDTYKNAVIDLTDAIKKEFPKQINMTTIYTCKQKADETTDAFIERVTEVLTKYSGVQKPH